MPALNPTPTPPLPADQMHRKEKVKQGAAMQGMQLEGASQLPPASQLAAGTQAAGTQAAGTQAEAEVLVLEPFVIESKFDGGRLPAARPLAASQCWLPCLAMWRARAVVLPAAGTTSAARTAATHAPPVPKADGAPVAPHAPAGERMQVHRMPAEAGEAPRVCWFSRRGIDHAEHHGSNYRRVFCARAACWKPVFV